MNPPFPAKGERRQIGQVSWLGLQNLLTAPSRPKISDFGFSILDSIQNPQSKIQNSSKQWLVRAAFVALTVAGQQGHSPPFRTASHFGFSIADFGFAAEI
jgi:hypothetical protein